MKVFVCSPYRGDIERNTKRARAYVETVITQGHTPFAPHLLYTQILDEETDRELGMELGLDMLTAMDELWGLWRARHGRYAAGNQQCHQSGDSGQVCGGIEMKLTIFTANCAGNALNPYYPNRVEAMDEDSFKAAVSLDHVAAEFKGAYRSNTNFIQADHISMDVDNELSDEPEDWITPGGYFVYL